MTTMTGMYLTYVALCVGITVWVARTLRKHGRVFLTDGHEDHRELSEALSHLLVVGFYLVNFGVISFALKSAQQANTIPTAIELLSSKVGLILLTIGAMHFMILATFASVRRANERNAAENVRRNHLTQLAANRRNVTEFIEPA
ncbi:MAG TPA: hypothetical protein VM165_12990 [Planctomycetaceae bacterium]|nr:hypothetical protein [Planctomycetaceae bacterium]